MHKDWHALCVDPKGRHAPIIFNFTNIFIPKSIPQFTIVQG
jgi:hypothetical protein